MLVHLDTDFGGDTDDACALAMVLGWAGAEITGITTVADPDGRRAGYVRAFLRLAGRADIAVAAGAGVSSTTGRPMGGLPDHRRYWDIPVAPAPAPPGAAVDLLDASIERGATVVAIGPYTNLALLEQVRPDRLAGQPVVAMGGWVSPPAGGFPSWGPDADWNVQCDTRAAQVVAGLADLTLCALPPTMAATLRRAQLPRLAGSGRLGALLARQSEAYARDNAMGELGRRWPSLPDDLVNVHWDPVACAVALGWAGATTEEVTLRCAQDGAVLRFTPDRSGRPTRLLTAVDGTAFAETWIAAVEAAQVHR